MDAAQFRSRTRRASPIRASSVRARNTIADENPAMSVKGGNLSVSKVTYPGDIAPNGTVTIKVTVQNGAATVNPLDPDRCGAVVAGYQFDVEVDPDWAEPRSKSDCMTVNAIGAKTATYTFTFAAPAVEGAHDVSINLGVTNEAATGLYTIQVSQGEDDTTTGCTADDDCDAGYACVNGVCVAQDNDGNNGDGGDGYGGAVLPCFADPTRSCEGPEAAAWMILVSIVITAVLLN